MTGETLDLLLDSPQKKALNLRQQGALSVTPPEPLAPACRFLQGTGNQPAVHTALHKLANTPRNLGDLFAVAADAASISASAPSSYPEHRHLVGLGPSAPSETQVFPLAPAVAPVAWSRTAPLVAGGRSVASWNIERLAWEHAYVTRQYLAQYDAALCGACAEDGRVLQHSASARQRLTPYRCQTRATCPACGTAYGLEKGRTLASLLEAAVAPGRLLTRTPDVLAWHMVLSCDARISSYVDDLVVAGEVSKVRSVVTLLTEDVQESITCLFGPGVAAVVVWHWWHSGNPLEGGIHLHAHVTVPNVRVNADGTSSIVREQGKLSPAELYLLRSTFGQLSAAHKFSAPLFAGGRAVQYNAHVRFSTRLEGGAYALRHRARYDARHPIADLLTLTEPEELRQARQEFRHIEQDDTETAGIQTAALDANPDGLRWWVHAASIWQGIQTTRYTGWLANRVRKGLGLVRAEDQEDDTDTWSTIGVYTLLGAEQAGVRVRRHRDTGQYDQTWHYDHVQLMPPPERATTWGWDDAVRPLRLPGPPAWAVRAPAAVPAYDGPTWHDLAWLDGVASRLKP